MKKRKSGFTLAELLIVIAIIAILVAISIPVFTAQKRKAIIATNKANIRAAKAAVAAKLYESADSMEAYNSQIKNQQKYYVYNVKTGSIEKELTGNNVTYADADYSAKGSLTVNEWGRFYRGIAKDAKETCPKILVYLGNPAMDSGSKNKDSAPIQTAPYYIDNQVGGGDAGNANPFGPVAGSATGS